MTILADIIQVKEREVARLREKKTYDVLPPSRSHVDVYKAFRKGEHLNIIAEIKRASPSKGMINQHIDPVARAKEYERLGASAISVLTDQTFFHGSMDDLRQVAGTVNIPILCKDFMIDKRQINQAYTNGATIILLIVQALSKEKLTALFQHAKQLGLTVLCEVHDEHEMEIALQLGAEMIGINNRNLRTFQVDLGVTTRLAKMVTNPETIIISESGLKTVDDILQVQNAHVDGILVGETLMCATNLAETFTSFRQNRLPRRVSHES